MEMRECQKCGGQGAVLVTEVCDQYSRVHLQWDTCGHCGGAGEVEVEPREDDE